MSARKGKRGCLGATERNLFHLPQTRVRLAHSSLRLREALQLIDVRVLDYLIMGDTQEFSFADTG